MICRLVALPRSDLARIAPNYEAMRQAISVCEKVDEVAKLADVAVAAQAYYRQSQDVDNEMDASRIRMRAERKLGEILKRMAANGERDRGKGGDRKSESRGATVKLSDLGIPKDRASRAMQLAEVPNEQFETALADERVAQPRRILKEAKGDSSPKRKKLVVPIDKTLSLWGKVRDLGTEIESGGVPDLKLWRENFQPFQLDHLRRYIPKIMTYLNAIEQELEAKV